MRPSRRILPVGLALLLAASAFAAQGSVPGGYEVQNSTPLASGVTHESLTLADPGQSVQVARVAPGAARFVAVSSHDAVAHQESGAELPSDMCRRVACYAGINADFAFPGNRQPVGGVVSGGRLLRSPMPGRAQLNVGRDGRLSAGPLDWSGSVSGGNRTLGIGGVNVLASPGSVVLYTPAWAGDTPEGADTELIVKSSGAVGAIGATTTLQVTGVRSEAGPIPVDGAVLSASGSAAATLHAWADQATAAGGSFSIDLRIRTALDVVESVGGNPVLLHDGHPAFPDADDSFTRARHPRSLVGWNGAGEVVLVTVDAGRDGASGMTLAEAAELLTGLGATEGFGFDNAAATFVAGGEVRNVPIDDVDAANMPYEGREVAPGHYERPAANTFMAVAKAADPPPAPAGGNPASGNQPGPGGTTATTAQLKLTTAGGGSAPATGGVATPAPSTSGGVLGGAVTDILKNPHAKRPRRQTTSRKGNKKDKDGEEEEAVGDPSIPDWNDITAALTPEAVAAAADSDELSLGAEGPGGAGPGTDGVLILFELVAAGMIASVLWGIRRAHTGTRPQRVYWY